jgi:maltose alpha-D-glucosyltransferase/alpha-amylase
MRKQHQAFSRGSIEFVDSDNPHVLSFIRKYEDDVVLVVANLSRFCQVASLELNNYKGFATEEIFSRNNFPPVTEKPYILTVGPHSFYWLVIRKTDQTDTKTVEQKLLVKIDAAWKTIVTDDQARQQLSGILRSYIQRCRWFGGKGKTIRRLIITDSIPININQELIHILMLRVLYVGAPQDNYLLPICLVAGNTAAKIADEAPQAVIAALNVRDQKGLLCDAAFSKNFQDYLLDEIVTSKRRKEAEKLKGRRGRRLKKLLWPEELPLESRVMKVEQSNTSINYNNRFFFKLYRRLEGGSNPDVELSRYLTEYTDFKNFPTYIGSLEWSQDKGEPLTIGLLLEYVPNESDGWTYMLSAVERYFAQAMTLKVELEESIDLPRSFRRIRSESIPPKVRDLIGSVYIDMAALLGRRTAEMHLALASLVQEPEAKPEPFSLLYQKSVYQSMRALTLKVFSELGSNKARLSDSVADEAGQLFGKKQTILRRLARMNTKKIVGMKIRIHGDYHLGQVLYTGKDFVIIDFEGEPARPLGERRLKRSALRDVAGMIRSFHYAAYSGIFLRSPDQSEDIEYLKYWADFWYLYISGVFLDAYLKSIKSEEILPVDKKDFEMLLETFLLEKAIYELGYELNNRPDWIRIPIRGIENILKKKP